MIRFRKTESRNSTALRNSIVTLTICHMTTTRTFKLSKMVASALLWIGWFTCLLSLSTPLGIHTLVGYPKVLGEGGMASSSDPKVAAILRDFEQALEDLTFNSKPLINDLTMAAEKYKPIANRIVEKIEARLMEVAS